MLEAYNLAVDEWDLSGPYVADIGDVKVPSSYSIDRSRVAEFRTDVLSRSDWVVEARNRESGTLVVCALTPYRDMLARHLSAA